MGTESHPFVDTLSVAKELLQRPYGPESQKCLRSGPLPKEAATPDLIHRTHFKVGKPRPKVVGF